MWVQGLEIHGYFFMEQVFYFLLWVTNRHGNRPTELIKNMIFLVSDVGCYFEMDNS